MRKSELIELLKELNVPLNEYMSSDENKLKSPRIVFGAFALEDKTASDDSYLTIETIQIDVFSTNPYDIVINQLRAKLKETREFPTFYIEFNEDDRLFHTYFSIEVESDDERFAC